MSILSSEATRNTELQTTKHTKRNWKGKLLVDRFVPSSLAETSEDTLTTNDSIGFLTQRTTIGNDKQRTFSLWRPAYSVSFSTLREPDLRQQLHLLDLAGPCTIENSRSYPSLRGAPLLKRKSMYCAVVELEYATGSEKR